VFEAGRRPQFSELNSRIEGWRKGIISELISRFEEWREVIVPGFVSGKKGWRKGVCYGLQFEIRRVNSRSNFRKSSVNSMGSARVPAADATTQHVEPSVRTHATNGACPHRRRPRDDAASVAQQLSRSADSCRARPRAPATNGAHRARATTASDERPRAPRAPPTARAAASNQAAARRVVLRAHGIPPSSCDLMPRLSRPCTPPTAPARTQTRVRSRCRASPRSRPTVNPASVETTP
jgi:hypothetical protein